MIFISRTLIAAALVLKPFSVSAQQVFDAVEIRADDIAPGIAVLFGAGGNMAVSYGEDATILVDDQFAELSEKIIGAIAKLGASPVEFVVNTHWHYDHTGGNAAFGRADATLIAHHNVRSRLRSGGRTANRVLEPASAEALPIITFEQGITLHQNGDTIDIIFTGGGHTDGDAVLLWREDNVIHTGDLYSNTGSLPFTDLDAGGNIRRSMNSLDLIISMIDDKTVVIPGHGPLSNKLELIAYRVKIGEAVSRIEALKRQGKTLEEAVAANPLDGMAPAEGFNNRDSIVRAYWQALLEN